MSEVTGVRPLFEPVSSPWDEPAPPAGETPQPPPEIPEDDRSFAVRVRATRSAPSTPSEGSIVADCLRWLAVQPRTQSRKVHQSAVSGSGEPDLDICCRGRAVKVEVKRPGEHPTAKQMRRMKCWRDAGALVGWVTSLDELRGLMDRVDDPAWQADLTRPGA